MGRLFKRRVRLSVGPPGGELKSWIGGHTLSPTGIVVSSFGLKITFNITKSIDAEPNKASIKVYNLNRSSRDRIGQKGDVVKLEFAYDTDPFEEIFNGEIRFTTNKKEKADTATFIESGDGDTAFNGILLNETIGPGAEGVSVNQIFARLKEIFTTEMAAKFGNPSGSDPSVDGDYDSIIARVSGEATSILNGVLRTSTGKFRKGKTLKGTFGKVMGELSERVGVDFFVNNQTMYVLKKTDTLNLNPILLTVDTGLTGVPSKLEDGSLQVKSLIVPGLLIGREIVVESREVIGTRGWKITRLALAGDTMGPQCNAKIDAILAGAQV